VAAAAGIANVCTDPQELIARDDLDAIAISTPPGAHHALSIAALRIGKRADLRRTATGPTAAIAQRLFGA
jgi:predicted dehydrogenase